MVTDKYFIFRTVVTIYFLINSHEDNKHILRSITSNVCLMLAVRLFYHIDVNNTFLRKTILRNNLFAFSFADTTKYDEINFILFDSKLEVLSK